MNNNNEQNKQDANKLNRFLVGFVFLCGLLLGGLAGAGAMLLLAPQSGKKTRTQIRRKGRDLRVQTTDAIEDWVEQVTSSIHEQAEDLQHRGQDVVDHGKERLSVVVEAGKTAVHGS